MSVVHVSDCKLVVGEKPWQFACDRSDDIARNWTKMTARNPKFFDGDVFVVDAWSIEKGVLEGQSLKTKFSAYLYWRDVGVDDATCSEAFTTTVVMSRDGGMLLARSATGTLNEGFYGSPGGLLDLRDMRDDGRLDLADAAARELAEETGLDAGEMQRDPGFLLAHIAPYLAIASVYNSSLTDEMLLTAVVQFLATEDEPELEAPVIVRKTSDLNELALTPHARLLAAHVLA